MTRTLKAIVVIMAISLIGRGTDYVTGDVGHKPDELSAAMPELVWGWTCLIVAVIVLFGVLSNRLKVTVIGSLCAASVYVMFAWYRVDQLFHMTDIDDWRLPIDYTCSAGVWAVICMTLSLRMHVMDKIMSKEPVEWTGTN